MLAVAVLAVAGCGSSSERSSTGDRGDAAAFVRAADRFLAVQDRAQGEAFVRVREALDRCPPSVRGRTRQLVSDEAYEFELPVRGQLALPGYRRLAAALRSVGARDHGLREIASAARTIAREDGKLGTPALDLCAFLAGWAQTTWSQSFPDAYYVQLCRDADYAADDVAQAQDRIQARVLDLARLGLSSRQKLDLYTGLLSPLFAVCNASR
jgi:hypothetical protein